RVNRAAVIATCKFGQRTLYSRSLGGGLAFASDLQALRRISNAPFELDPATIGMGLLYGGVAGRATTLRGVTKVLPGTSITLEAGRVAERLAADIPRPGASTERRNREFYVEQLDAAMRQAAVRLAGVGRTHAVMLGSGVDSSLVAAYARPAMRDLVALTQQMPGDDDESSEAAAIAGALGIPQTVVPYGPRPQGLVDEVAAFVRIAEEPAYWNQLGPPLLRLLDSVAEPPESFLTGAEGDFLFIFRSGRRPSVAQVVKDGIFWPVASYTARRLINRVTRHTYVVGTDFDLLDRRFMRQHLAVDCTPYEGIAGHFDPSYPHLAAGPNAQRHFINNGWQNVRIIGQFGQNVGAEVLFPYMDDDVVSCVLSLPDELKINKGLLRILLARTLPRGAVTSRKRGYWAHTIRWHYELGGLDEVLGLMLEPRTLERGVFEPRAIEALVGTYARRAATGRDHPVLWQLLVFELFCREFIDRPHSEP
ncbi:MAG: asparagine synthase-related protein, partial [Gemmatimonadaceae bacterium]